MLAHVTEPGGINVVEVLAPLAVAVADFSDESVLVSVCHFTAGTARQVTAANGYFDIDLRSEDADAMLAVVERVRELVEAHSRDFAGELVTEGGMTRPALDPAMSRQPWELLQKIDADRARSRSTDAFAVHERGGSDASFFAAMGVPTLDGFGAICGNNCAPGEYIETWSITDPPNAWLA